MFKPRVFKGHTPHQTTDHLATALRCLEMALFALVSCGGPTPPSQEEVEKLVEKLRKASRDLEDELDPVTS